MGKSACWENKRTPWFKPPSIQVKKKKKARHGWCLSAEIRELRQPGPGNLLSRQSSWMVSFRISERPGLKRRVIDH